MRGIRLWQGLQVRSGAGKGQANVHVTTGSSHVYSYITRKFRNALPSLLIGYNFSAKPLVKYSDSPRMA